ncbi:MAG: hypothetical protein JWR84_1761 [Caulobacter sp.]|nr:hypothetical protein [Caulobacter sp.]
MEDLFRSYWWLVFPAGFFIASAFSQLIRYLRYRDSLTLIKSYTDQGKEPPAALLDRVTGKMKADEVIDDHDEAWHDRGERRFYRRLRRRERSWYSVVLFGVLACGFGFAAFSNVYSASGAFLLVTIVMAALCLASLVSILTSPRD